VEETIRTEILFLEGKLQELNEDVTSRQQTNADIERIEAQIQIVNRLLKHYRLILEECAAVRTVRAKALTQAEMSPQDTVAKGLKESRASVAVRPIMVCMPSLVPFTEATIAPAGPSLWSCSECQAVFDMGPLRHSSPTREQIRQINLQFEAHCRQVHPGLLPVVGLAA
jgi:hypothetical protein